MKTVPASIDAFVILDAERRPGLGMLDPIHVMLLDESAGVGSLTIGCFGKAWTYWWNAMGVKTVREFLRDVTCPDYVASCLMRGARDGMKQKAERQQEAYLLDICTAVKAALKHQAGDAA